MRNSVWKFFGVIGIIVTIFFVLTVILVGKGMNEMMGDRFPAVLKKDSILVLDLRGVIMDGRKFLHDLRKYRDNKEIKGVLVRIDSPGGVVGPSQEIYSELKRVRDELKKPVVVSISGLAASGGFYSAVAADWIVTTPGAIVGSIGVIMEFANLEGLYDWAKVKRYSLTTGKFKDTGAEYRKMNEEEKSYLQGMINEVLSQFIAAVADGRKIPEDKVRLIADGRIVTGAGALKLGLVDQVGTFTDAVRKIGALTNLGDDPELYTPVPERPSPLDFLKSFDGGEEDTESKAVGKIIDAVVRRELIGKPLFLMPGTMN